MTSQNWNKVFILISTPFFLTFSWHFDESQNFQTNIKIYWLFPDFLRFSLFPDFFLICENPEMSRDSFVMGDWLNCPFPENDHPFHVGCSAVDNPKFMGRPPTHAPKTGLPESFLGCPNYYDLPLKETFFFKLLTQNLDVFSLIMFLIIQSWVAHRATSRVMLDRPTK